ncbi:MAG: hypothetical protein WCI71_19495 [Bacteroidota bacterium]
MPDFKSCHSHPEDIHVRQQAIDFQSSKLGDIFGGLARIVNWKRETIWFLGMNLVLNTKNGMPWQFLNVVLNIQNEFHSQKQLLELQRENMRFQCALSLRSLTKREKYVLDLLAKGRTDEGNGHASRVTRHDFPSSLFMTSICR